MIVVENNYYFLFLLQREAQGSYCCKKCSPFGRLQLRNKEIQEELRDGCGMSRLTHRSLLLLQPPLQTPLRRLQRLFQLAGNLDEWRQTEDVCCWGFFFFMQLNSQKCQCEPLTLIWSFSERCRQTSLKSLRHMVIHEHWFGFVFCFASTKGPVCEICL